LTAYQTGGAKTAWGCNYCTPAPSSNVKSPRRFSFTGAERMSVGVNLTWSSTVHTRADVLSPDGQLPSDLWSAIVHSAGLMTPHRPPPTPSLNQCCALANHFA